MEIIAFVWKQDDNPMKSQGLARLKTEEGQGSIGRDREGRVGSGPIRRQNNLALRRADADLPAVEATHPYRCARLPDWKLEGKREPLIETQTDRFGHTAMGGQTLLVACVPMIEDELKLVIPRLLQELGEELPDGKTDGGERRCY